NLGSEPRYLCKSTANKSVNNSVGKAQIERSGTGTTIESCCSASSLRPDNVGCCIFQAPARLSLSRRWIWRRFDMSDRRGVWFLLAILALGLPAGLTAETPLKPEKIVAEYVNAMGGSKILAKIQTESIAGNLTEMSTGRTGSYSLITKAPNRFYLEQLIEPDHEVTTYNGMSAWAQTPADGVRTLTGAASREAEGAGRYWNGRLFDVKKDKLTLQWIGSEKVRGRDAYHLRIVLAPKVARDVFFDTKTHLILREGAGEEQFDYDDYRP